MRPKTAHAYNCNLNNNQDFLEDKEQLQHPGPNNYDTTIEEPGKGTLAKFRSTQTGGMMVRSQRFFKLNDTPGPATYEPKKISMRSYCQGSMGRQARSSWIDRAIRKSHSPGPGDYVLPSDFGHLAKPSKKRLMTIQWFLKLIKFAFFLEHLCVYMAEELQECAELSFWSSKNAQEGRSLFVEWL